MKKIFGGINLTYKRLIIAAVIIGVSVGLLNSVDCLFDTTITDIATYFDFWIFFGIFIIMNSKSNKDSAIKCFLFFLISQPLIYLAEVPFNRMGWDLFIYYKPWFIWTLLTIPMGYIGYYIKKDKWYGLVILTPVLALLSSSIIHSLTDLMQAFPRHIINLIFVVATTIIYPLYLFNDKRLKYIGLSISTILVIVFTVIGLTGDYDYHTQFLCSDDKLTSDTIVKLENEELGNVSVKFEDGIDCYCIQGDFKKQGDSKLIIEYPDGEIVKHDLHVGKETYTIDGQ